MKLTLTILAFLPILVNAAEPPRLLSMLVQNDQCAVTWSHPTAKKFEIIVVSPTFTNASSGRSVRPTPGLTNWVFTINPKEDFECAVRAVSSVTDRKTEVGNAMRYDSWALGNIPPDPLDKRRWSQSAASMPGTFTSGVGTQDLVMTWKFNASVEPGFDFRVYESQNLKDWRLIATVPLSTNAAFNVPKWPYSFYKVSVVHQVSGIEHWNAVTNLFMDP